MDPKSGFTYIILDAIDECAENSRQLLIESIRDLVYSPGLAEGHQQPIKFLLTSRPIVFEQPVMSIMLRNCLAIDESRLGLAGDVVLVIQTKIDELARIYDYDEKTKTHLTQTLYSKADQTFL